MEASWDWIWFSNRFNKWRDFFLPNRARSNAKPITFPQSCGNRFITGKKVLIVMPCRNKTISA